MASSCFDYQNNRWAGGNDVLARRWYEELERANPENVRASSTRLPVCEGPSR